MSAGHCGPPGLGPLDPDHETLFMAVARLRAVSRQLIHTAIETHLVLAASSHVIAEPRDVIADARRRLGPPDD